MSRRFAHDVARGLVFAQALERRMAQRAIARPFGERNFADELRTHPVGAPSLSSGRRVDEWRLVGSELLQSLAQHREQRIVEAGADLPAVTQLSVLVHAEQQRAE